MLTREPEGRYQIHELLRQYAQARLETMPEEVFRIRDLYIAYYTRFLHERTGDLNGSRQREALLEVEADIDNIRTAWLWAVEHSRVEAIEQAEYALFQFYAMQSRFYEGTAAFEKAVETIRSFGYPMNSVAAPFGDPSRGIANIETDRKTIAGQVFKDIDVLLLPTTTTTVPTIENAGTNPQALSPENTAFANYYGLPAISVLCGFDTNGLPLGLQIVSKPWGENAVLRLAYQYEVATEYLRRYPYE